MLNYLASTIFGYIFKVWNWIQTFFFSLPSVKYKSHILKPLKIILKVSDMLRLQYKLNATHRSVIPSVLCQLFKYVTCTLQDFDKWRWHELAWMASIIRHTTMTNIQQMECMINLIKIFNNQVCVFFSTLYNLFCFVFV